MPDPNGIEIASMYVGHHGIEPKAETETNSGFRARVATVLRAENMVVDAHEVFSNRFHDEKVEEGEISPAIGAIGAAATTLKGMRGDLGTDLAAGVYLTEKEQRKNSGADEAMLMLALALMGGGK